MINPINIKPIVGSVIKSRRLLIVEEGSSVAGFGSEVISKLVEADIYPKTIKRMGNNNIIPCSIVAENNLLPNERNIYETIKIMIDENN
jgi:pyruvate/2-oxoglutarate/acetoin dehydrogenase E1 component